MAILPFMIMWLIGTAVLLVTYWATQRIRPHWLRQFPRALVAAFVFAPSWSGNLGGGAFFPVVFVLRFMISDGVHWRGICELVVLPLAVCFLIFWGVSCFISFTRREDETDAASSIN